MGHLTTTGRTVHEAQDRVIAARDAVGGFSAITEVEALPGFPEAGISGLLGRAYVDSALDRVTLLGTGPVVGDDAD